MAAQHDISNCRKCFYLRIVAVLFWSVGLVVLSLLPNDNVYRFLSGWDKLLHFSAYLVVAWLSCRSLLLFKLHVRRVVFVSAIYSLVLGALLEVLQHVATGSRSGEWSDLLANITGVMTGCVIFCLQEKFRLANDDGPE